MRKISKMRTHGAAVLDSDLSDTRPRGIPGATITSWPGSLDIDLDVLFARGGTGATVTGSAAAPRPALAHPAEKTIALSDGTRITFASAGEFDTVELV